MKRHGLETVRCTTHFSACDCREAYVAQLETQLAEAREALKLIASCKSYFPGDVVDIAHKALAGGSE